MVEKGGPVNSYAMAFGILGGGVLLAVILWSVPLLRRRRQVRRFRKALDHVDVVTMAWSQSLRQDRPFDDLPSRFDGRRSRWHRHGQPDDGGASLV